MGKNTKNSSGGRKNLTSQLATLTGRVKNLTTTVARKNMSRRKNFDAPARRKNFDIATTSAPLVRTGLPAMPRFAQPVGHTYRCSGTEILFSGLDVASYSVGNKIHGTLIAPASIGGRLAMINELFEKYRINSLAFEITCTGATTSAAAIIVGFDADAGDADPTTGALMRSWQHNLVIESNTGGANVLIVRVQQPDAGYYTSYDAHGDYRLSFCGQFYTYLLNKTAGASVSLMCSVHYDVTFYEPQLNNPITNPINFNTKRYDSGFVGMFGSSVLRPSTGVGAGWWSSTTNDVWKPSAWVVHDQDVQLIANAAHYLTYAGGGSILRLIASGIYTIVTNYLPHDVVANSGFVQGSLSNANPRCLASILENTTRKATIGAGANAMSYNCDRIYVPVGGEGDYQATYEGAYTAGYYPEFHMAIEYSPR